MSKSGLYSLLITSILISGCSSKESLSFDLIDEILEPTETTVIERTPEWYSGQEFIRKEVITACFTHFEEKGEELGSEYQMSFIEDHITKFKEFPDCINAHNGNLLALSKNNTKIYKHEVEQVERSISNGKTQAEIEAEAQLIADRLSNSAKSNSSTMNEPTPSATTEKNTLPESP